MYIIEKIILSIVWISSFISIWFIPRKKYREASFIFLFTQVPAWIFGLLVVEAGLIVYPIRLFAKANATSFTFEYLVLPILCVFFNLYYPNSKDFYKKIKYHIIFIGIFTIVEYLIEKNTLLIDYMNWEWYITFITMSILFYFVRGIYKLFFKLGNPFKL